MSDPQTRAQTTFDASELWKHRGFLQNLVRGMISDEHGVEDVLQDTWMQAMQREPKSIASPRAWLARVARNFALNRVRGERRLAEREAQVARTEAQPDSYLDTLLKIERQQALLSAIKGLSEGRRSAIHLHYFDGQSPTQIAESMGVPINTVYDRLRSGRADLRAALVSVADQDVRAKNQHALSLWMLPLAGLSQSQARVIRAQWLSEAAAVGVPTGFLLGGVLVSKDLCVALGLLLSIALLAWSVQGRGQNEEVHTDGIGRVDADAPYASFSLQGDMSMQWADRPAPDVNSMALRSPLDQASGAATQSAKLHLQLNWEDEGTPAEGIRVRVYSGIPTGGLAYSETKKSSLDGVVIFDRLGAGRLGVWVESVGSISMLLAEGETRRIELTLSVGSEVRGRVEDWNGAGIAGAQLTYAEQMDFKPGRVVGNTDSHGEYAIRFPGQHPLLGAWASGYLPSTRSYLATNSGHDIELTLVLPANGSRLKGVLRDAKGKPIANARLCLGYDNSHSATVSKNGGLTLSPSIERVTSDLNGIFEFNMSPAGMYAIQVRAAGFGYKSQMVEVGAGDPVPTEIVLEEECVLDGVLRAFSGELLGGVDVGVSYDDGKASVKTKSASDGTFRLLGLASGQVSPWVSPAVGKFEQETFQLEPGEVVSWEVTLKSEGLIIGTLLDEGGKPLEDWIVCASRRGSDVLPAHSTRSDSDGGFCLPRSFDKELSFIVREPGAVASEPALRIDSFSGIEDELNLVIRSGMLATASVVGAVVADDGAVISGARLVLSNSSKWLAMADPFTGGFHAGLHRPGPYQASIQAPGYGSLSLGEIDLLEGQQIDLGTIVLSRPGAMDIQIRNFDMLEHRSGISCQIMSLDRSTVQSLDLPQGEGISRALAPGEYIAKVSASRVESVETPVTIRAGEIASVRITLRPATTRILRVIEKEYIDQFDSLTLCVTSLSGSVVANAELAMKAGHVSALTVSGLSLGAYQWEISTSDGQVFQGDFAVSSLKGELDDDGAFVDLELR